MVLLHRTQSPARRARALDIIRQFDELEGVSGRVKPTTAAAASTEQRRDSIFFRPRKQHLQAETSHNNTSSSPAERPDLTKAVSGDSSRSSFCSYVQYNYLPIVRHEYQTEPSSEPLRPEQRYLRHAYLKVLDARSRAAYFSRSTGCGTGWWLPLARRQGLNERDMQLARFESSSLYCLEMMLSERHSLTWSNTQVRIGKKPSSL